jgi:hypothetical protein
MEALPGRLCSFRVIDAPNISLVPYLEVENEHFTAFPLFATASAEGGEGSV